MTLMLKELPGPYAILGWLGAGALMLVDGLIWSELGAALPGSGGSYRYLLECYGPNRWGRLAAFLFIWRRRDRGIVPEDGLPDALHDLLERRRKG